MCSVLGIYSDAVAGISFKLLQSSQGWKLLERTLGLFAYFTNQRQRSIVEATPLQPEAGSCLSHSPQSVRLSGSWTVSARRDKRNTKQDETLVEFYKITPFFFQMWDLSVLFQELLTALRSKCFTSLPISMAHSLADWSLASTMTLNMVHSVGEMRKSVDLLLLASLDSNAILVLQCKCNNLYTVSAVFTSWYMYSKRKWKKYKM